MKIPPDIFEQKSTEDDLPKKNFIPNITIQSSNDGILVADGDGLVIVWNVDMEKITGISGGDAIGMAIWDVHSRLCSNIKYLYEDRLKNTRHIKETCQNFFFNTTSNASGKYIDFDIKAPDGLRRQYQIEFFAFQINQLSYWMGIARDLTDYRRKERAFREGEKLIAAGQIASRIVHEINNPLAGIKNAFLLLEKAIPEDFRYYPYVGRIKKEIDRITRIVHQMYELYRPAEEEIKPVNLRDIFEDISVLLESRWRQHQVKLIIGPMEVPEMILLPEDPLRQVLFNLISNAIDASPIGGDVTLTASIDGENITITIQDQGEGIPEELRTLIYEPFFSTKKEQPESDLGLGLPVSKNLMESMGGTIRFSNRADHGTIFFITLPLNKKGA